MVQNEALLHVLDGTLSESICTQNTVPSQQQRLFMSLPCGPDTNPHREKPINANVYQTLANTFAILWSQFQKVFRLP